MTKLLEKAVAKLQELPDEDQDAVALAMMSLTEQIGIPPLDDETRAAIQEGIEQARRREFATDEEIAAIWRRHGL